MNENWISASKQLPPQWAGDLDFEMLFVFKDDPGVYPGHRDKEQIWIGDSSSAISDLEFWKPFPKRPLMKGTALYYRGLNWVQKTFVFQIVDVEGVAHVEANNGVTRPLVDVENNACDLYTDVDKANQSLVGVYMAEFVKP